MQQFLYVMIYTYPIGSMYGICFYLHLPEKSTIHVGKYTSPMDAMGILSMYLCL